MTSTSIRRSPDLAGHLMLHPKIASVSILTLDNGRVPEVAASPRVILQGWNEIQPPRLRQIISLSDHLTACGTCTTPGFNSRLKYDD
jgi:hypothetical protein